MTNETIGLTEGQNAIVEQFLHLFSDVEKALKTRLRKASNDRTGFGALVNEFVAKNSYWTEIANQLRNFADIRNLLAHQRGTRFGYPIAVAPVSLSVLREIKEQLLKPEPVSARFRKSIIVVSPDDSIACVLALAFENGFSQFPAVSDGQFCGLITENEITRWLGRRVKADSVEVNLGAVCVRTVLKEKDPFLKGISIFRFEKLDTPLEEVIGRFSIEPMLEVVLLTATGNRNPAIEGIVTQWDAARYRE